MPDTIHPAAPPPVGDRRPARDDAAGAARDLLGYVGGAPAVVAGLFLGPRAVPGR